MKTEYFLQLNNQIIMEEAKPDVRVQDFLVHCFYNVSESSFLLSQDENGSCIEYHFSPHQVNNKDEQYLVIYLTYSCERKTRNQAAKMLDIADFDFIRKMKTYENKYHIIRLYDERSIFFCSKAYPIFCLFESKLRCLILKILTKAFGSLWEEVTIAEALKEDLKKKNKIKIEDLKKEASGVLYEMDYGLLIKFLFKPYRSLIAEDRIDQLLNDPQLANKDVEEIRKALSEIKQKSNWERYFSDIKIDNLNNDLKSISQQRNKIAHSKLYTFNDYSKDNAMVSSFIKRLDAAITSIEVKTIVPEVAIATTGSLFALDFSGATTIARTLANALANFAPIASKANAGMEKVLTQVAAASALARDLGKGFEKTLQLFSQIFVYDEDFLEQTDAELNEDSEIKQEENQQNDSTVVEDVCNQDDSESKDHKKE